MTSMDFWILDVTMVKYLYSKRFVRHNMNKTGKYHPLYLWLISIHDFIYHFFKVRGCCVDSLGCFYIVWVEKFKFFLDFLNPHRLKTMHTGPLLVGVLHV